MLRRHSKSTPLVYFIFISLSRDGDGENYNERNVQMKTDDEYSKTTN